MNKFRVGDKVIYEFKPGDLVQINKPTNVDEGPCWQPDSMDFLNKKIISCPEIRNAKNRREENFDYICYTPPLPSPFMYFKTTFFIDCRWLTKINLTILEEIE